MKRTRTASAPKARRNKARSEAKQNSGEQIQHALQPLIRGDGNAMRSKIAFIKGQTMRPQDNFEFLNKGNRSMMFFLSFDVTTHLRNLRLADRERAISFLPRESCGLSKRSRNPVGRIRLHLTDEFRDRFVLPQFRQDVDMVRCPVHNYGDPVFIADRTAKILMNSGTDGSRHPRLATLCRKDNVIKEIAIGGTHRNAPFRRPSSGALLFSDDTPGVPLRSTPSCSFAALHCRLYSAAPSALSSIWCCSQRRRRAGVKPAAQRSGAPGHRGIHIIKPLKRGGGQRGPDLGFGALK